MITISIAAGAILLLVFLAYRNGKTANKQEQSDETIARVERSKKNRELVSSKSAIDKLQSISKKRRN